MVSRTKSTLVMTEGFVIGGGFAITISTEPSDVF